MSAAYEHTGTAGADRCPAQERRGPTLHEEDVDINGEIAAAVRVFEQRAAERHVGIHAAVPPYPCRAWADRSKLRQILVELISWAVAFTPPGGVITVSSAIRGAGDLSIAVAHTGLLSDRDQVIASAQAPFFERIARGYSESGLGLSLARVLVECHGGELRLENSPGNSPNVRIILPRTRIITRQSALAPAPQAVPSPRAIPETRRPRC